MSAMMRAVEMGHKRCRCILEYYPGSRRKRQNAWTKQWTDVENNGRSDIIKVTFRTTDDPMREVTGSAEDSYPDEVKTIVEKFEKSGVQIKGVVRWRLDIAEKSLRWS